MENIESTARLSVAKRAIKEAWEVEFASEATNSVEDVTEIFFEKLDY